MFPLAFIPLYLGFGSAYAQSNEDILIEIVEDLRDFVSIPNHGINKTDIDKNLTWLSNAFDQINMPGSILPTEGNPLFFAQKIISPDLPTVMFYMHLDGQPVDATKWDQPNPYQVVLKEKHREKWQEIDWNKLNGEINSEWRLFGRSAADDKAPIIAFIHAVKFLERSQRKPAFNIKIIIDAEEEIGSKSLPKAVEMYRELLSADLLIINDGPVHISGDPTLIFGCRGSMRLDLTVYGPVAPQHSGHFGNYAPNPVFRLANLLSSMKDSQGRVTIDGYYDGVHISAEEQKVLDHVPDNELQIKQLLQIAEPEKVGRNYQEALQYPSLNARGLAAGWVGNQARTIIPDFATVAMDIRLVPESHPDSLIGKIKQHIRSQGFHIVNREPTKKERLTENQIVYVNHGNPTLPFRTPLSAKEGVWLAQTLEKHFGKPPVKIRMMGGTVPITAFISGLDVPAIIVPMVNADNNQHSPNENMRLGHLQNAFDTFVAVLRSPFPN